MMKINPTTAKDFYKAGHPSQYPKGTEFVYSNFTPRSDAHAKVSVLFDHKVVWFGLQGFLKWFLIDTWNAEFFHKPKSEVISAYKRRMDNSLGPDSVPVDKLEALHDLGYLPILIKALPEGSRVNIKVPFFTVQNTHKEFFWLTNYIETILSNEVWKPTTVATIAFEFRRIIDAFVELTGSSPEFADWQCHDFSMRGMSGTHDASSSSAGHLLSNFGTDTIPAIDYLENYYNANSDTELVGGSVPATEHAIMAAGGNNDGDEVETIRRIIQDVYPIGIVSVVSDTWDFWKVITETALELKEIILERKVNSLGQAKVVFRPDSGDPVEILCGIEIKEFNTPEYAATFLVDKILEDVEHGELGPDNILGTFRSNGKVFRISINIDWNRYDKKYYYVDDFNIVSIDEIALSPEEKGAVECLWEIFGGDITDKGFKTLNQRVGLIYGDSITLDRQYEILRRLVDKGFSAGNVVYGIGSYTYQMITRDTFGMAMKATYSEVNSVGKELFKDPKTDSGGVKKSAKGLLRVEKNGNDFVMYDQQTVDQEKSGVLEPVFLNGKLERDMTLKQVRENLQLSKIKDILPK